jgi:hypothetical protein
MPIALSGSSNVVAGSSRGAVGEAAGEGYGEGVPPSTKTALDKFKGRYNAMVLTVGRAPGDQRKDRDGRASSHVATPAGPAGARQGRQLSFRHPPGR